MSLMSALVRHVCYPFWMIRDGDARQLELLDRFDDIDRLQTGQLLDRQLESLRKLMTHAASQTGYYANLFQTLGFSPSQATLATLRQLPLLTKDIIRDQYPQLVARNVPEHMLTTARTGGSTGRPMTFVRDKECLYLRKAQELYFDRWMGFQLGDKAALFVAASHFDSPGERWKAAIRNATCDRLLRFDPHHITDAYMAAFLKEYRAFDPKMVKCFPNSLAIFADYLARHDETLPPVSAISSTGENLYPHQRALFEQRFGGRVFEKYGTRESGVIACECREHNGLHLFTDGAVVEVINAAGEPAAPGEMGRLVVTDLFNYGMPMIRYEIGDMAIAADRACPCGSPLPLVERILGRDRDILYDADGNPKPGYLFVEVINSLDLPAQFQVIQTDRRHVVVRVVKQTSGELVLDSMRNQFQEILGPDMEVAFHFTDEIARDPSGKFRYVMSQLPAAERPASGRIGRA